MTEDYNKFITDVKSSFGIDLTLYKEAQMKRRLTSLRDKNGYRNFRHYLAAINQDDILQQEFLDRITINVSGFYRNQKRWDVLKSFILPQIIQDKKQFTVWSAACSTGEEPYSIAMVLRENFPETNFRVLATDIDSRVLKKAEQGIYPEQSLRELPTTLKQKYFSQHHNWYYLDNAIKQHVEFKNHDLLTDKYPAGNDLIICRNVLIYFTDQAKSTIYSKLSQSLKQNGVVFVGSTEQIFSPDQYNLALMDTFFYQKKQH